MRISGVDFPEPLLKALHDGRLVVFAGAGISMGPPANLPSFSELARQVAKGTGLTIGEHEPEDRFLGQLKAAGTDVHQIAVQRLRQNDPQPKELHRDLLRLYPYVEDIRIVTTNFDLLFEEAVSDLFDMGPRIFYAPELPLGERLHGIIHIHGSVSEPEEMILTDRDFGRAYLTQADGWARRFLVDLFANHTVLFVGYSHNDTIMNYLTPSLPPDGYDMRYALIGDRSDTPARWRSMGIHPITFPQKSKSDYSGLDKAVAGLANHRRRRILGWQQEITNIASAQPPIDEEASGVIEHALTDSVYTRFFTEAAESPEWIAWLDSRNYLDSLFSYGGLNQQEIMLSLWLRRFAVKEPDTLFSVIERHGSRLNTHLWNMIASQLSQTAQPLPDPQILSRWVHFLISVIPPDFNDALLEGIAENCATQGLLINLLKIYDTIIASRRQTDPRFPWNNSDLFDHQIRSLWEKCLEPNLPEIAEPLLERTVQRLEERHSLLRAWEGEETLDSDTFSRSAIEPHEQDSYPEGIDALIDIARDCLESLTVNVPDGVKVWCERYGRSPSPLLRRLAVHILPARTDLSPDEKLAWLLERYDVNELPAKHEIFRAVARIYPAASLEQRGKVIDAVLSFRWPREDDPERDILTAHHNFDWLQWLNGAAPNCELTKTALDHIRYEYPQFLPSEHPDFNTYWSICERVHGEPSRWSVPEILGMSPGIWLPLALEEQPQESSYEPRDQIIDNVREVTKQDLGWGFNLANEMVLRKEWDTHIWRGVIRGVRETDLDQDGLTRAVQFMAIPELHGNHGRDIADTLRTLIATNRPITSPTTLELANGAARNLWLNATTDDRVPGTNRSDRASYQQSVDLAEFWIQSIATWREHQETAPTMLGREYQEAFSEIMENHELPGKMAREILGSHVSLLVSVDEEWTRRNLIPLLDHDHDEFESSWNGITRSPNFTTTTAELLREPFLQAVEFINDRMTPEIRGRFIASYTSMLTWFVSGPTDQWITKLIGGDKPEARKQFAQRIEHRLALLEEPRQKEWWTIWLKGYWENRLIGIPTPLDNEEIETMLEWVAQLTSVFPEAVSLAVRMRKVPLERTRILNRISESGLIDEHPNDLAKFLIHLGQCDTQPWLWYRTGDMVERLLAKELPRDIDTGLRELVAKNGLWMVG